MAGPESRAGFFCATDSCKRHVMKLEELRASLSDVDRRLVELIAERQHIVGEIGRKQL